MADALHVQVGRGVSWSAVDQVAQELLRFGSLIVLSRLLTPADFGVVTLLTVFTGFVGIFAEFQIANVIVQQRELTDEFLDTAFWANLALGVAAFALVWLTAPLLALAYAEPGLVALARVTALGLLIVPFGGVPSGLLLREIDFRRVTARNIAANAVMFGSTALLAWRGLGAMSLALGGVAGAAANSALAWIFVRWRPRLRFARAAWRQIWPFTGRLSLSNTIGYWSRNLDLFLIGSLAGDYALGLYSRAMLVLLLPLRKIATRVDAVMFPALATIQQDPAQMAALYLRATRLVALVTTPIAFGAAVVAPDFVPVAFGAAWTAMVPLVQILAPLGALQSILTMGSAIYLARGRADLDLRITTWCTLACSLAVLTGLKLGGVTGVAIGYAIFSLVSSPFIYLAGARQVGLGLADQAGNIGRLFLAAALMAGGVFALRLPLANLGHGARLVITVIAGAGLYALLLHVLKPRAYVEACALLRGFFLRKTCGQPRPMCPS